MNDSDHVELVAKLACQIIETEDAIAMCPDHEFAVRGRLEIQLEKLRSSLDDLI